MQPQDDPDRLTTAQVARRLGVKPETVYAYVSRGVLHSARDGSGRGSWFDRAEVDRLAGRATRGRRPGASGLVIRTALTLIDDGRLAYRGLDATELAREQSFETVAHWLWLAELDPGRRFAAPADAVRLARTALAALPSGVRSTDRLRVIAGVAASADPLRFNTEPESVAATGAGLLATMVDALPPRQAPPDPADRRLAARLWPRLTARPATPAAIDALNAALVLLADHDLAASTVAARVAASTRAHPYAVVAAGLSAFEGPLHGAAASRAYRLLAGAIATGDPMAVYSESLRTGGLVEDFVHRPHPLYPAGDVRAAALLELLAPVGCEPEVRAAIDGLLAAVRQRSPRHPTVEFALAALAHVGDMIPDAGEAIFAIARTAGWIAHAMEEYREPGLRFRFRGSYDGPRPTLACS
ncbi:citrate synthase [Plantactinospora siamensis]|uniref:citrate synthase (unknown stereospecificity) n=1 Tax=Plantactinospora siamensis TaxID=555372 RepID=A0ABV6NU57_9ACTN